MQKMLILASFSNRIKKDQNDETKYIHRKKICVNFNQTVLKIADISIPAASSFFKFYKLRQKIKTLSKFILQVR